MASDKDSYILISLYKTLYKEKYGKVPTINQYREKWAMKDVVDSVGFDRAKELLEYYFKTSKYGHPLTFFYYNFDQIDRINRDVAKDLENRRSLREATKKLVEGGEE